jgi:CheY-like chemotaxis protein
MESKKKRILVVEDQASILMLLIDLLGNFGYNVDSATNGAEALEKIKRGGKDRYDMVLSDVKMPVMNGVELYNQLGELNVKIKFAFMTGYTDLSLPPNIPVIDKPFPSNKIFLEFVKKVLET